jgi:hypothetical protein
MNRATELISVCKDFSEAVVEPGPDIISRINMGDTVAGIKEPHLGLAGGLVTFNRAKGELTITRRSWRPAVSGEVEVQIFSSELSAFKSFVSGL